MSIEEVVNDWKFFTQQQKEVTRLKDTITELQAKLAEIANQKLCCEMPLAEMDVGDIEALYDQCILTARQAEEQKP